MWILVFVFIIIVLIFIKFQSDTKNVKERNLKFGGLKNLFPAWVNFARENNMEIVKDSGTDMDFRRRVYENGNSFYEFFITIQSKTANIASGWVIHSNGKKIKSVNVTFGNNLNRESVEKVVEIIAEDLASKGAFDICRYGHEWEYLSNESRRCKNCSKIQYKSIVSGSWM